MKPIDVIIVILVSILMLSIIFFSFIFPRIKGRKGKCNNCPVNKEKKIKRAFKDYHKDKN